MTKGVNFGVFLPFYAFRERGSSSSLFVRICDVVLECERLGYHSVWLDDHLMFGEQSILECWATLSALSALTTRIRLGSMVTCNSFRNPGLLTKIAATLDIISGGRLEFGIGAGVQETEHCAYDFSFPKPRARVERLCEALEIIKALWSEAKVSYAGKYYNLREAICEPKPLQKPHPPITIGGSGEKMTLRVSAEHADRYDWGYLPSLDLYEHKLKVLESHCKAVGRNFEEIEKSCWPGDQVVIANNRGELREKIAREKPKSVALSDFERTSLIGTPNECVKQMQPYVNLGVTHFMLFFGDLPRLSGLRLFGETVTERMQPTS